MSTFKGKQHVGEKFVVMSSQAARMMRRHSGCLMAEEGKMKWCINPLNPKLNPICYLLAL